MPVVCPICGGSHPKWECKVKEFGNEGSPPKKPNGGEGSFGGAVSNPHTAPGLEERALAPVQPSATVLPATVKDYMEAVKDLPLPKLTGPETRKKARAIMAGGQAVPGLAEGFKKLAAVPGDHPLVVMPTPGVTDGTAKAGYNAYMREYMRKYRAKKKATITPGEKDG